MFLQTQNSALKESFNRNGFLKKNFLLLAFGWIFCQLPGVLVEFCVWSPTFQIIKKTLCLKSNYGAVHVQSPGGFE